MADENVPAPTRSDDQILPFVEEFVQAIQTFLTDKANLGSPTKKGRKDKPHVIPYCRFMKIIICHLGRIHNIHQRSASPFHFVEEDFGLGNLKFVPKGEIDEVFGMPIHDELILNNIRNAPYYNAYLEMVVKHDRKVSAEKEGKKKTAKSPFWLVDEPNEEPAHSKPEPEIKHKGEEATQPLLVVEGKGKAIATEEQAVHSLLTLHTPKRRSATDQFILQRRTLVTKEASTGPSAQAQDNTSINIVRDLPSPADAEIETGVASEKANSGVMNKDQAGSDPGKIHGALTGPDPEPMHDEFMVDLYPKFINDKSTKDKPGKLNAESEVVSMVTVLIHQASFSIPPLSTPIVDLSPPKPTSSTKVPIFTAATTTTTTNLPLPPPPPQQSTLDSEVFTLELKDLPHKIDEAFHESVKEVVHIAFQAPLRDRFRELPEADMKEILHQWMFESGSYKSLPEHVALYEALEANALATMYQDPTENSLLEKTGDIRTFMHCKGSGQALSISKMKAALYLDFGLEQLVPEYMWINEICTYDISASYGFEHKHIYTIIDSPHAVVFPVGNNERKIMRFNEIYKFSDGTLTNITEALDFRVKEYKVNRLNSGMNMQFWTDKDVARSKEFIHAIEQKLKTRRIF
uniref:Histone deacetylase 14 n=1 Tax=Tanacetum cinerariifolium TaxID=118510 RepID=A0A699HEP5_TANCI|nr:hypothetical protein [Tanacetum cinerariifolium]